ncbi:MAG: alanine--tRNA ligase [Phycisphaerae bacterium]|nr:alanine--tRNA ligase [Phycisphaerae bacterium]
MLTSQEIRGGFIDFFKSLDHKFIPSSPIVPIGDETLLFANAGMNQYKDIFLGLRAPDAKRAANSQKCLRVSGKHNDLEEVGKDTYHHTFFEMLGNWSFNDYFKAEAIEWAWKLLTEVWKIDPNQLWATVFVGDREDNIPRDSEAEKLWTKVTSIRPERVLAFGKKDNFWEMGATGPCGPCSEIHIDLGSERCDKQDVPGHKCEVNAGCARFIELWNLVFIQYNRGEDGKLTPLNAHYIDTGAGLERVTAVLQNKKSNYDTDLFMPIIGAVEQMTGRKYTSKLHNHDDNAFRVIADHIRTLIFAITDGATPSNDGRGYVIRRILRRASRFGRELDMHKPFLCDLVPVVVDMMGDAFAEIKVRSDYVSTVIEAEEKSFNRTLDRGIEIFNSAAQQAAKSEQKTVSGDDAFSLYDTYGFPLDLTQLMAQERGLAVDTPKFDELMQQQRNRARAAQKTSGISTLVSQTQLPVTEDVHKYETERCETKVVGFISDKGFSAAGTVPVDIEVGLVLGRTCFYAESGGQVGDCGKIEFDGGTFVVENTTKLADCVLHHGQIAEGTLSVGETVTAVVSKDRQSVKRNHTATHLLQWALQQTLGSDVRQQGSLVGTEYLRFDFTWPKAMEENQIAETERLVQEKITEDLPVTCSVLPRQEAEKLGAMALFGEKYGEQVRVVALGTPDEKQLTEAFSREFCGGTHVGNLGQIGDFKITKEESVSAGVRRITAITGRTLADYLHKRSDIVDSLVKNLKVPAEGIIERIEQLLAENKKLAKDLKTAAQKGGSDTLGQVRELLGSCERIGDTAVVVGKISSADIEQVRGAIDMLRKKEKSVAVVLGFGEEDKVTLIAAVTDDLIKKGLKAGDIVKEIAPIVDGGGGGRPQMAQAGGKNPAKLDEALQKAKELMKLKLA